MKVDAVVKDKVKFGYGRTALHDAVELCLAKIAEILIEKKANVNQILDSNKSTTMLVAAKQNGLNMMKLLIKHGFNCDELINAFDESDYLSVFLSLCAYRNVDALSFLIDHIRSIQDGSGSSSIPTTNEKEKQLFNLNLMQIEKYGKNCLHLAIAGSTMCSIETKSNEVQTQSDVTTDEKTEEKTDEKTDAITDEPKARAMIDDLMSKALFPKKTGDEAKDIERWTIGNSILNGKDATGATAMDFAIIKKYRSVISLLLIILVHHLKKVIWYLF